MLFTLFIAMENGRQGFEEWTCLRQLISSASIFVRNRNRFNFKLDSKCAIFEQKWPLTDFFYYFLQNLCWHITSYCRLLNPVISRKLIFNSWTLIFAVISWFSWCLVLWFFWFRIFDFATIRRDRSTPFYSLSGLTFE